MDYRVTIAEDDPIDTTATRVVGTYKVRTEGLDSSACRVLIEGVASLLVQQIGFALSLERAVAVVRYEAVALFADRCLGQLVVGNGNRDTWLRGEDDGLHIEGSDVRAGVLRYERSAEVELIIASTRESYNIRCSDTVVRIVAVVVLLSVIRLLIVVLIDILEGVVAVIVVPEEGVGIVLTLRTSAIGGKGSRLQEVGYEGLVVLVDITALELTQPVLVARGTALIEVGDLTLIRRRHEFGAERQTDSLPA